MLTLITATAPFAGNDDPIRTVELELKLGADSVVRATLDVPPSMQGLMRSEFEVERLGTLLAPIALRLARTLVPTIGRSARLYITV